MILFYLIFKGGDLMRSTFMGLEAAKRGLFTQQSALYTTGHNIANANTEGYTRQRVNMQPTLPYPGLGLNNPTTAGYIGTGVEAGSVQRIRDDFVDKQYRQETNKLGYWSTKSQSITELEDVMNEPSDYGLAQSLNDFYNSLQDLNVNPEDGGARAVVVQRGISVADSFNYLYNSINQIKENAAAEIGITLNDTNSILHQIASINEQIQAVEPNGYIPNDLYDARTKLLDELSNYLPIEITATKSGGNASAQAEGSVTVSLKLKDGTSVKLVDGKDFAQLRNSGATEADGVTPASMVTGFHIVKINNDGSESYLNNDWSNNSKTVNGITDFSNLGTLKSLVDSYGYSTDGSGDSDTEKGIFPDMLKEINLLAKSFAKKFNEIHQAGTDMKGNTNIVFFESKDPLTTEINAGNIYINEDLIKDPSLIAASDSPENSAEPGNGNQALKLANMKFQTIGELGSVSAQTFYEGIIGQLGVDGQAAARMQYNSETLQQSVAENRASVSSVSLDEEMTNMITFQQAYNANARMLTVIDEMLEKIINGMGRVGL